MSAIDSSCMAWTATQKKTLIMAGAKSGMVILRMVRVHGARDICDASSSSPCTCMSAEVIVRELYARYRVVIASAIIHKVP